MFRCLQFDILCFGFPGKERRYKKEDKKTVKKRKIWSGENRVKTAVSIVRQILNTRQEFWYCFCFVFIYLSLVTNQTIVLVGILFSFIVISTQDDQRKKDFIDEDAKTPNI